MEIKIVLCLPREVVSVPVSRQVLDGCLATLGVTPDTRADIALALSEACANVIQHAGPGEEYAVQVSAKDRHCVIEVVNTGEGDSELAADGTIAGPFEDRWPPGGERPFEPALADDPVAATAEHGRGLKIIDAVMDNLQLTSTGSQGTAVRFEKKLDWLPGTAGQRLFDADGGS
ncbi:MAG TPA: ATP-binding protein [Trebonia sp.]|nr:ATP-binding protein [Trebonia sp.]